MTICVRFAHRRITFAFVGDGLVDDENRELIGTAIEVQTHANQRKQTALWR